MYSMLCDACRILNEKYQNPDLLENVLNSKHLISDGKSMLCDIITKYNFIFD